MPTFTGDNGDNIYTGGTDNDTVIGNGGNDTLSGGGGNDTISGGSGADTIDGGDGSDTLYTYNISPPYTRPYYGNPWTPPLMDTGAEVDTVTGGAGSDTIFAGYGDHVDGGTDFDTLIISFGGAQSGITVNFNTLVSGGSITVGGGTLQSIESIGWVEGSNFDDTIVMGGDATNYAPVFGMGGNDHIIGGYYTGDIHGGDGDDIIDRGTSPYGFEHFGEAGNDLLIGSFNGETLDGGDGNDELRGHGGYDRLNGGNGDDLIDGGSYGDDIRAGAGNDTVYGGGDADTVDGGAGDDIIHGDYSPLGSGNAISPSSNDERIFGGAGADTIYGDEGHDQIWSGERDGEFGATGRDDSGIERDQLFGGSGNDALAIGIGDDANGGDGSDTLSISLLGAVSGVTLETTGFAPGASWSLLGGVVQNVETISAIAGSGFADTITIATHSFGITVAAGAGNDLITSSGSSVIADGGAGDDTFVSGAAGDIWNGGAGSDTVSYRNSSAVGGVTVTLAAVAGQTASGPGGDQLTNIENIVGSSYGDTLTGNGEANVLRGDEGADTIAGGSGNDTLLGGEGNDALNGGDGNDTLDGGAGVDQLSGGAGNDLYLDIGGGDTIVELANAGVDEISTQAQAFALAANVENLTFIGVGSFEGYGNELGNRINSIGGGSNDILRGLGGNDFLFAGNGDDILDGGAGADAMYGGNGDDDYYVDSTGDVLNELSGEGADTVFSTVSFALSANVESLSLTGADHINGTGNALNNGIFGNAGSNLIDGGAGADTMGGGAGDDTYFVDSSGDIVGEFAGEGNDSVRASVSFTLGLHVEHLTLTGMAASNGTGNELDNSIAGSSGDNLLAGLAGNDSLLGGAGADILSGGTGVDTLTGGAGADAFTDSAAGLNGDTITDFGDGDRIVITDASLASFSFSLTGSTLSFTGGSLTLAGGVTGRLVAAEAAGGGVQITVEPPGARNDFDGDGRSDILWRHDGGLVTDWLGTASGGFANNYANAAMSVPTSWQVAGTGDFNGDGRFDLLWRHDSGLITDWLGTDGGGFADNFANASAAVATSWQVAGTGDFDGDGLHDLLWRHDSGLITNWLGEADGGFGDNFANASASVVTSWHVAGTGDFNGDGRADILWRHDGGLITNWLGEEDGGFADNYANAAASVDNSWHIVGTGDLNGDGRDDILWRHDSGLITNWLGEGDGGFAPNNQGLSQVALDWSVAGIGDYNGDRVDDILWRHDSGLVTNWLGTGSGGFVSNNANAMTSVPTDWEVQSIEIHGLV